MSNTKVRFRVVSYDDDQQQAMADVVLAANYEDALAIVAKARPYAVPVQALTVDDLKAVLAYAETGPAFDNARALATYNDDEHWFEDEEEREETQDATV